MALQGRAGPALGIAAFGSFFAGTFECRCVAGHRASLGFRCPEIRPARVFFLDDFGLIVLTFLGQKSMIKSLMMAGVGILLGTIGLDTMNGVARFSFHIPELLDGLGLVPMAMGLFGIAEIFLNSETAIHGQVISPKITISFPV